MRSTAAVVCLLATFFVVLGVAWFVFIQVRCAEISPRPVLATATLVPSTAASVPATATVSKPVKPVIMVRSPYAKAYHDILFWTLASMEVFVAVFYVLAGAFLIKRYVLARLITLAALSLDLAFKLQVVFYMQFCAIPLAHLTKNHNILILYFTPSAKMHAVFSPVVSGLKLFLPGGAIVLAVYVLYFGFCFSFFNQQQTKDYLTPAKKI